MMSLDENFCICKGEDRRMKIQQKFLDLNTLVESQIETYPEASDMESSVLALAELTRELARN